MLSMTPARKISAGPAKLTSGWRRCRCTVIATNVARWSTLSVAMSKRAPKRDSSSFSRATSPSQPSRMQLAHSNAAPSHAFHELALARSAAPPSPTRRLTAVITFGVTGVRTNSRERAMDSVRSRRARYPSLGWRSELKSRCSASRRPAGSLASCQLLAGAGARTISKSDTAQCAKSPDANSARVSSVRAAG